MCSRCWCSRTHIRLKICNKVVWEWIFIGIEARRATMLHANTTSFPFRTSPIAFVRSVRRAYGMPFSALLLLFFFHNFSCSQSNRTCSVHGCHVTDHISYYDCESCTEIKTNLLSRKIQSDPCRIGKILWKKRKESAGGVLYTYGIENPFFFLEINSVLLILCLSLLLRQNIFWRRHPFVCLYLLFDISVEVNTIRDRQNIQQPKKYTRKEYINCLSSSCQATAVSVSTNLISHCENSQ